MNWMDGMKATEETIDLEKYIPVALHGIEFQCDKGHIWESAVGAVWLQMPTCPICSPAMSVPAISWKGRWTYILKTPPQTELSRTDKLTNEELARAIDVAHRMEDATRSGSEKEQAWKAHLDSLLFIQRKRATGE